MEIIFCISAIASILLCLIEVVRIVMSIRGKKAKKKP